MYTGGKDSTLAIVKSIDVGLRVRVLLTVFPEREDSWMFHTVNLRWTRLQSESMGIPQHVQPSSGVKEEELRDLREGLEAVKREYGVDTVVVGAFRSLYQRSRVERVARELGLRVYAPLWRGDAESILETYVSRFRVMITGVFAMGLDEAWLGRILDRRAISDLKRLNARYGIDLLGEGGEYETFVLDAPIFKYRVEVVRAKRVWRGDSGVYVIEEARLAPKPTRRPDEPHVWR